MTYHMPICVLKYSLAVIIISLVHMVLPNPNKLKAGVIATKICKTH